MIHWLIEAKSRLSETVVHVVSRHRKVFKCPVIR